MRELMNHIPEIIGTAVAAVVAGHLFLAPLSAYGASLPYIDDANEWSGGKTCITVTACGKKSCKLKVTDCKTGKRVKVTKHKPRVWTVVIRNHRTYKLSVKDKGGWKTIRYRIG